MYDRELRLECLKIAQAQKGLGEDILTLAVKFYEWTVSKRAFDQKGP